MSLRFSTNPGKLRKANLAASGRFDSDGVVSDVPPACYTSLVRNEVKRGVWISVSPEEELQVERDARFSIGDIVHHRVYPFRGVIYDVDPTFGNTDEWWESIPEKLRPAKDQPYYHLLAENDETTYTAYVSEQNLVPDKTGNPCRHPLVAEIFDGPRDGRYRLRVPTSN